MYKIYVKSFIFAEILLAIRQNTFAIFPGVIMRICIKDF